VNFNLKHLKTILEKPKGDEQYVFKAKPAPWFSRLDLLERKLKD
jgi:hypothetical protein